MMIRLLAYHRFPHTSVPSVTLRVIESTFSKGASPTILLG